MIVACVLLALQAESAPTLVADAGWRGRIFADGWAPVVVRVQASAAFEGRLVVRVQRSFGDDLVIVRALSLPGRVDRRHPFEFLSTGFEMGVEVEVEDRGGRVVARLPLTLVPLPQARRRVLVLGDATGGLKQWAQENRAQLIPAGDDGVPFTLSPLLGFDTVVVTRAVDLLPAQEEALRRFVSLGGRFVAMTGSRATQWRTHALAGLLPAEATGTAQVAGGVIGRWKVRDGREFAIVEGHAMGVRARRDRGESALLAFAPESGAEALEGTAWDELLGVEEDRRRPSTFRSGLQSLFAPISDDLVRVRAWPVMAGAAIAVVYVVIIGPLHAFRRRAWRTAWLRLTGCAGVFGAALWGLQARYGAAPTQLREVTLEDHAGDVVLQQSFAVFVPKEGGVQRVGGGEAASIAVVPHVVQLVPGLPEAAVEASRPGELTLALPAGARRALVCARAGESALSVRRRGGLLVVRADQRALEDAVLVTRDDVLELGSVPAGETREFALGGLRRHEFVAWRRALETRKKEPAAFETLVRDRLAYGVTFYGRLRESSSLSGTGWTPRGLEMRGLDLSEHLARGASVLVARAASGDGVFAVQGASVTRRAAFVRVVVEP